MNKTGKTIPLICTAGAFVGAGAAAVFAALHNEKKKKSAECAPDLKYLEKVGAYSFFKNSADESIPIYNTYYHIKSFLDECSFESKKAVAPNGKTRKVLFLGFDGARCDALPYIVTDENGKIFAGNAATNAGAISRLAKTGGLYLAYCGGETEKSTEQTTSTSAGWTTHFTGVWGSKHGVKTNDDVKNNEYETFMLQYARKGLHTSFAFDWDQYIDLNIKNEVKCVKENNLPMLFCDIDRPKKTKLKNTYAESLELYNYVAPNTLSPFSPFDCGMRDFVIERANAGDDIISAVFHNPDTAGHSYGFGDFPEYRAAVVNCDLYAASILNEIERREKCENEEWLVIMASDHGGIGCGHGAQTLEERTTWIASNKEIDKKLFGKSYDGHKENIY